MDGLPNPNPGKELGMQRIFQSFAYILGIIFFASSQVFIWSNSSDNKIIPYLLTSIFLILIAIYLKEDKQ